MKITMTTVVVLFFSLFCASQSNNTSTKTFTVNDVSFKMVALSGGTFTMGATSEQGNDADSSFLINHPFGDLKKKSDTFEKQVSLMWKSIESFLEHEFQGMIIRSMRN